MLPLVSCIMPTYNRRAFVPHAIRYFLRQQYAHKELVIIDDGEDEVRDLVPDLPNIHYHRLPKKITLGAKLNMACRYAKGTVLINWDDDDWYAFNRIQLQVQALEQTGKQVCGINRLLYLDVGGKQAYEYVYPPNHRVWLLGSSLCYTRALWERNHFADIDVGMDGIFIWNTPENDVLAMGDNRFAVHLIHPNNVSPKNTSGSWWHACNLQAIASLLGPDWLYYASGKITYPQPGEEEQATTATHPETVTLKNVYACLVHEQPDCITDLVRNLHYHDPSSAIILYNGSNNPGLIPAGFPFAAYNAVVHPAPVPMKHGYLHLFALHCMAYALEHLQADTITIVDSDQLCVKTGYSAYLQQYLCGRENIGLLSSNPDRVDRSNTTNHVALQGFREYELWKPLLQQFDKGEDCFVHWTFWPAAVFTASAARDLLQLFRENTVLQHIMRQTRIWASEEVILPTLVKLLGYDIAANPCSYSLVRYKQAVRSDELQAAFSQPGIFWVHPVARLHDDAIRKRIRTQGNNYTTAPVEILPDTSWLKDFPITTLLASVRKIEGWLSDKEAELLVCTAIQALRSLPQPHHVVEIGSYHGKSTVLLGAVIKQLFPGTGLVAIDPHDGKQGAVDQGLHRFPPSLAYLQKNVAAAGITEVVEVIQDHSYNVEWDLPVSLLFIDGLHDYGSVYKDFHHFSDCIQPGGYIAFHDYADYFPGVKKMVDELLATGRYQLAGIAETIRVIQKK